MPPLRDRSASGPPLRDRSASGAPLRDRSSGQPDSAALWRWLWASIRPYLGYILIAIGGLLLLAGYLGVSREVIVARQIPYLVSGGLLGLAAITLGSRLLLIEDLRRDSGRINRLEKAVLELHQVLLYRPDVPSLATAVASVNGSAQTELLVLPGGESFHRPDCPVVGDKPAGRSVTLETAQRKGLKACPLCQPLYAGV
jgi:hypothetical protein